MEDGTTSAHLHRLSKHLQRPLQNKISAFLKEIWWLLSWLTYLALSNETVKPTAWAEPHGWLGFSHRLSLWLTAGGWAGEALQAFSSIFFWYLKPFWFWLPLKFPFESLIWVFLPEMWGPPPLDSLPTFFSGFHREPSSCSVSIQSPCQRRKASNLVARDLVTEEFLSNTTSHTWQTQT